jgi:hypothetical protein
MGFFSKKKSPFGNKYAAHPDVLDDMAENLAKTALWQIKTNAEKTRSLSVYVELGSWSVDLNSKAFEQSYHSVLEERCYNYSTFGMEDVPEEDARLFLQALLPFLEQHIKIKLKSYFPNAHYATVTLTTYNKEHRRDTDYDIIDVIEISVSDSSYSKIKNTPRLNKW